MALDPFTQQIIRNFLFSTTEEMIQTTVLTAYSPTFSEGFDFSCALFDKGGRMVIQSRGIGVHLGSLVTAMQAVVAKFPAPEPGDVYITNNPYYATHQSDVVVCRPMFFEGAHLGFAVNIGHWTDIGGMSAGGCAGTSTHVVQDGLIIPLSRLYRRGELVEETRDFILANVRLPEDDWGDLMSQISATAVAETRIRELAGRHGVEGALAGMEATIAYSRDRFLARMKDVPDGRYEATDFLEDDGLGGGRYAIRVAVTKSAEKFVVDFSGTADHAPTPINAALSSARAAVYTGIIALVDPLTPVNQGIFDLIELVTREGMIVHAVWPTPVYGCTFEMAKRVPETILKAFGARIPEKVAAGCHASGNNLAGRSVDPKTGEDIVWYNYYEGGQGATHAAPGNDAVYFWGETSHNQPIEVWEHKYQVLVERYSLRDGSGGRGRQRGGMGTVHEYRLLADHQLSGLGDRHLIAPWGLEGGEDGAPNRWSLRRDGQTKALGDMFGLKSPSKFYNIPLLKGDVLIIETAVGAATAVPTENKPSGERVQEILTSNPRRSLVMTPIRTALLASAAMLALALPASAQDAKQTLIIAGPRTPESLELEYPATEAVHEARKNIYERLLAYAMKKNDDGIMVEDFDHVVGSLAKSWDISPDRASITFHLADAGAPNGDKLTADDVMWTFKRGWAIKGTFYWYMHQMLKIEDFDKAFSKIDDMTVKVQLPGPSPLIERLWVNNDLGIIDGTEAKKHLTDADPNAQTWLSTHTASFAPYGVTEYTPGREVIYEANANYFRGPPPLKKLIFREMPSSANRVAALQAGSIDVAEWLLPRELNLLKTSPGVKVWTVYGNYIHRVEMNNTLPPFDNPKVRQALNYLVPRDQISKSVYFGTARETKSPLSEIYPAYTDSFFKYDYDVDKAKALLKEAGLEKGFKTVLGYRTGEEIEEQIAVILKTNFAKAGVDVELEKMPSSSLVDEYTKGKIPMYFLRDMAIVPDAAYVTNLWLNSHSMVDYSRYKDPDVDALIDKNLVSTDDPSRIADMKKAQQLIVDDAPWVFLFNPGYQLATRANVTGVSWYTPNGNAWFDFSKN